MYLQRARIFLAALCGCAGALGVTLIALSCSGPERRLPELPDPSAPMLTESAPLDLQPAAIILDAGTLVDVRMPLDAKP